MKKRIFPFLCALFALCLLCGCSNKIDGSSGANESAQPKTNQAAAKTNSAEAVELVADISTTQYFTDETVADADIEKILTAGVNTPSAMNGQPWHFSAITDAAVLQQISDDMSSGTPPQRGDGNAPESPKGLKVPDNAVISDNAKDAKPPEGAPPKAPTDVDGDAAPTTASPAKAGIADAPLAIVISCKTGSELDAGLACQNMSVAAQLLGYGTKIISSPTMALNGTKQAEYKALLGIPDDQTAVAILLVGHADTAAVEAVDAYTSATVRNPMSEMVTYIAPQ